MRDEMADDEMLQQQAVDAAAPGSSRVTRGIVVILWLLAVGGLVLLVPLTLLARNLGQQVDARHVDLAAAERRIEVASTPDAATQKLLEELDQLKAAAEALEAAQAEVLAGSYDDPAVMAAIAAYPRESVRLEALSQREDQITVEGRADSEAAVAGYAQSLEASGLFAQVLLRALEAIPEEEREPPPPVVAPGEATLTPTLSVTVTYPLTPVWGSPTPGVGDALEPDPSQPIAITPGEPQTRTFYPLYVLHRATFVAQVGAVYRVRTLNLAPGVDTFLVVMVGDATYVNHNRAPGELASEIMFQAHPTTSLPATVTVTNRGEYGPDKTYQLLVEQVPLTATPTPTITNTPSPIATATPTVQPTPTLTPAPPTPSLTPIPSATLPMPDPYEPDDVVPVPIAVGETQERTFYPQNDVDRVVFLAKAGRRYRVRTSNLALGVDTLLFAQVGADSYVADDVREPFFGSTLVFAVRTSHDVYAHIEVRNRGAYGPEQRYDLAVEEVLSIPTSTTIVQTFDAPQEINMVMAPVRAGRSYRVYTSHLGPCVDTVIVVNVGGASYQNDNRPGAPPDEFASEVQFTVRTAHDDEARIEVWSRTWSTGPECMFVYHLTVEEMVQPIDAYEPDDIVPRPITPGQTQARTFWPEGDVDNVTFIAKTGRSYCVFTTDLAPGVDTVLRVRVGDAIYVNDDRAPGDLSSEVCFEVLATQPDQHVVATITNRGQYGYYSHYTVGVYEVTGSWNSGGARGLGLAAWADGPTVAAAPRAAPQQIGPSATGPVRFTLVLRPKLREAP